MVICAPVKILMSRSHPELLLSLPHRETYTNKMSDSFMRNLSMATAVVGTQMAVLITGVATLGLCSRNDHVQSIDTLLKVELASPLQTACCHTWT